MDLSVYLSHSDRFWSPTETRHTLTNEGSGAPQRVRCRRTERSRPEGRKKRARHEKKSIRTETFELNVKRRLQKTLRSKTSFRLMKEIHPEHLFI